MFNLTTSLSRKMEANTNEEALAFGVLRVVRWMAVFAAVALMVTVAVLYFTIKYTLKLAKWAYDMGDSQPVSSYVAPCVVSAVVSTPPTIHRWAVLAVDYSKATVTHLKALYASHMGATVQAFYKVQMNYV